MVQGVTSEVTPSATKGIDAKRRPLVVVQRLRRQDPT